jgi:Na+/H+ antiporter NhaD/arsenite permease-like protein
MSSTLAGNLTITGSVANLIVVESARPEMEIRFWDYFRVGLPITLATLLVGWAWLAWIR